MYCGNVDRVMADAKKIARRLRETKCTLKYLRAEYHCGYYTMMKAIRSQIPPDEWAQLRRERLLRGGVKMRFKKGLIPWNKGKSYNPGGRCAETQFKKGNLPANHKKLGIITVRKDKSGSYRRIAVAGPTPDRHKWIPYAQYLWEKIYGPIPPGYFVVHANGNRLNDRIDNYKLVNRAGNLELMKRNNPGWKKKAIKSYKKTVRIRRMKKAITLRKAQKEAETLQKQQAKLLRAATLEAEQKKVAETEKTLLYGPQVCVWECINCIAEYEQENTPEICTKCGRFSFEQNIYRRKTG